MIIVKKELIEKLVVDETMELLMNDVLFEQLTDKFISLHRKRIHTCCFKKRACVDTKRRNRKQTQRNLAGSINNFHNVKMGIM